MRYSIRVGILSSFAVLSMFFICCGKHPTLGNVEDFYFPPIAAEYTYKNLDRNPIVLKMKICIRKVEKKEWGWIYYEDHESFPSEGALKAIEKTGGEVDFHYFLKVMVNQHEQYIEIMRTDRKWKKDGIKAKILKGPIWAGKKWKVKVLWFETGPIQVQSNQKELETKTRKSIKMLKYFLNRHSDVSFNNKVYPAIETFIVVKSHENIEITSKTIFLKGFGIYSFDSFVLNDYKFNRNDH